VARELLGDFITEATEHLEASDVHLLTLEKDNRCEEALNGVFRAFHTLKGNAGYLGLSEIGSLAHQAENLLDRARKGALVLEGPALQVTFEAVDAMKALIARLRAELEGGKPSAAVPPLAPLIERIVATARGDGARAETDPPASGSGSPAPEAAPSSGPVAPAGGPAATPEPGREAGGAAGRIREPVKVDAERMDRLIDMIGELVIAESMVSQSQELVSVSSVLGRRLGQLDKITRELQELGTSLRMVPLRPTFQRMARLVRDVAKKVGKPVEFVTCGEDTELDKAMVDLVADPLVHLLRNAVDHGIEDDAEARRSAGKSPAGRVELNAYHKGGKIHIEVRDDGRGLDREAIAAKARERGLLKPGEVPTEREVFNLILLPGFSTARKVTDVSGRGVGLDVVKRNVEALRGRIEISSEAGKGSVFCLRLPLTLAIIDGMVVGIGAERFIIPTLSILRSFRPRAEDLFTVAGKGEVLSLQGSLIPLFRLGRIFRERAAEADATRAVAVIVEDEGRQVALLVDELQGQQQIVIKSLGDSLEDIPGVSGGAILSDGQVGLILDVSGLVRLALHGTGGEETRAAAARRQPTAASIIQVA
jgi:two-component system, chemotaxis family, sensor kinase CheA